MRGHITRWSLLLGTAAFLLGAQCAQAQDGGIIGQVTDESGAVLPGVTVTATSPSLQVQNVTTITNERGEYRLTPLPIGAYSVDYSLQGFQTVRRDGLRLTVDFVAKVDVALKVGSLEESITVSGAAPVVDVKASGATTQLTRETLELIPTSRNGVIGLMAQAPGVRPNLDVGGSTINSVPAFHAFGQDGESWQAIEGVATTSPKSGNQGGNYWDYAAFEEAKVQTVGNDADIPTRGIALNAIVKTGGNDFHGSGFWAQTGQKLQSNNVDAALAAQGITSGNPVETRRDLSGELGGRVIRNKLWFYGSGRRREEIDDILNAYKPDGTPATQNQLQAFSTEKLSYQISKSDKLVGYDQWSHKNLTSGVTVLVPWASRQNEIFDSHTGKVEWQSVPSNQLVTSLQFGYWTWHAKYQGYQLGVPSTSDLVTGIVSGDAVVEGQTSLEHRLHTKGTAVYYKPNWLLGNHEFKSGFDLTQTRANRPWVSRGASGNYQLLYRNGVPFEIAAYNYPNTPFDLDHYFAAYVQDSWSIGRRVTVNAGVRYAHDNGFVPANCRVAADPPGDQVAPAGCINKIQFPVWNPISPRLHASWDVTGDAKTVVKGGWGRYHHMRQLDETQQADPYVAQQTLYLWHDLNGDKQYQPGEVNLDPNGSDYISTNLQGGGALANGVPNPNEKEPFTDEFSGSLERQIVSDFAFRLTTIYSKTGNSYRLQNNLRPYGVYTIPVTNLDPGPDGKLGTADDTGNAVTYYDYSAAYAGAKFSQSMLVNDPAADQTYKSFEVAVSKRLTHRWQFSTSYSATKKHIPLIPNAGTLNGLTLYINTLDPNAEIFPVDNTWEWMARSSAAFQLPQGILASANFEHRSGTPWARTVNFTGGKQIPSLTVRVEPLGTERLPNLNLLDLRAEKSFRITKGQRLSARLNVYNALNANKVTAITQNSGATFGRPTAILPPRTFEASASFTF